MTFFRILVLAFWVFSSPVFGDENPPPFPKSCQEKCVNTFGEKLGVTADGTTAYSNCRSDCVYEKPNLVEGNFAGIQWQCVEYARRWLMLNKHLTFESIDVAADLWNKIDHLIDLKTKKNIILSNRINGAKILPKKGDLLIYGREYLGTGHVAIVIRIDPKKNLVFVAEQNLLNKKWPGNYARTIPFVRRANGYWLLDSYLVGWKSY